MNKRIAVPGTLVCTNGSSVGIVRGRGPPFYFAVESSRTLANWDDFGGEIEPAGPPVPVDGLPDYIMRAYHLTPVNGIGMEFYRIQAVRQ